MRLGPQVQNVIFDPCDPWRRGAGGADMTDLSPIDSPETLPGWHMPWPSFAVEWNRTALIVVDLQNYGCNPEAGVAQMLSLRYPEISTYYIPRLTQVVIPNAKRLLSAFRQAGRQVLFTRHGPLLPDGRDMIARRRRRDRDSLTTTNTPTLWHKGTFEHEIVADLTPAAGEMVVDKNTSSAFNSTGIEWMLRNMGIETIVVVGMATDMCVETTARDAADRGFNAIIVEDASATFFERHHRAALSGFARVFGQVWTTERVLAELGRGA
jgi:nicotinamidase-related amidase